VARIHEVAEILDDVCAAIQPPVAQHPHDVAVHGRRVALLDDERAVQTPPHLLGTAQMRVIPERAGIGDREFVQEAPAVGADRRLGELRYPVHGVRNAHAVPVDSSVAGKEVLELDSQPLALLEPDLGAGHAAFISPYVGLRIIRPNKRCARGLGTNQARRLGRPGRGEYRSARNAERRSQEIPAVHRIELHF